MGSGEEVKPPLKRAAEFIIPIIFNRPNVIREASRHCGTRVNAAGHRANLCAGRQSSSSFRRRPVRRVAASAIPWDQMRSELYKRGG
jgi:hypothetical protein